MYVLFPCKSLFLPSFVSFLHIYQNEECTIYNKDYHCQRQHREDSGRNLKIQFLPLYRFKNWAKFIFEDESCLPGIITQPQLHKQRNYFSNYWMEYQELSIKNDLYNNFTNVDWIWQMIYKPLSKTATYLFQDLLI